MSNYVDTIKLVRASIISAIKMLDQSPDPEREVDMDNKIDLTDELVELATNVDDMIIARGGPSHAYIERIRTACNTSKQ